MILKGKPVEGNTRRPEREAETGTCARQYKPSKRQMLEYWLHF